MARKKIHVVELAPEERERLRAMTRRGISSARDILRARILLKADSGPQGDGWTDERIRKALETSSSTVSRVRQIYAAKGLDAVFARAPRAKPAPGGKAGAESTVLASSEPGKSGGWTLRLLGGRVKLEFDD